MGRPHQNWGMRAPAPSGFATCMARLLLSVHPRILGDTLELVLAKAALADVVRAEPGQPVPGHFEVAVVTGPTVADADVVVELLESGAFAAIHDGRGERIIELRTTTSLLELLQRHLEAHAGPSVGCGVDGERPAD